MGSLRPWKHFSGHVSVKIAPFLGHGGVTQTPKRPKTGKKNVPNKGRTFPRGAAPGCQRHQFLYAGPVLRPMSSHFPPSAALRPCLRARPPRLFLSVTFVSSFEGGKEEGTVTFVSSSEGGREEGTVTFVKEGRKKGGEAERRRGGVAREGEIQVRWRGRGGQRRGITNVLPSLLPSLLPRPRSLVPPPPPSSPLLRHLVSTSEGGRRRGGGARRGRDRGRKGKGRGGTADVLAISVPSLLSAPPLASPLLLPLLPHPRRLLRMAKARGEGGRGGGARRGFEEGGR